MKMGMKRRHETLLVAILAGMIMVGAAAFAVQPAIAKLPPPDYVRTASLD
jgi:hypothetical protein